jgi:hypothetical protein
MNEQFIRQYILAAETPGLFIDTDDSRSIRLPMEEWNCVVNAPVAFTARKYVTKPSAVVRLN